ncbi:hypothetical protein PR048_014903 [Dryococelus australis]|uniref:Uncharacterized protein n=1 Tax=Dryococelus australis TaxID=614101 RepID=A0ABQ9HFG1_9NEOP|nr:hypothetical protein PR048_014903 [Dryococelus australis]
MLEDHAQCRYWRLNMLHQYADNGRVKVDGTSGYHAYHYAATHHLQPADLPHSVQICQWLLQQHDVDQDFISCILWTDEVCFTREGITNSHNHHLWTPASPHHFIYFNVFFS